VAKCSAQLSSSEISDIATRSRRILRRLIVSEALANSYEAVLMDVSLMTRLGSFLGPLFAMLKGGDFSDPYLFASSG
jgi:hypothetical protein